MRAYRFQATTILGAEIFGEVKKHAVHIHKQILLADIPNSWPFGKPTVSSIIIQAPLGEEECGKFAHLHNL